MIALQGYRFVSKDIRLFGSYHGLREDDEAGC